MACLPFSTTSRRRGSSVAPNIPPVSNKVNSVPRHDVACSITSRVVPGTAVTMARRVAVIRLNRVDLPTLGLPTRTTSGARAMTSADDVTWGQTLLRERRCQSGSDAVKQLRCLNSVRPTRFDTVSLSVYAIYGLWSARHDQARHRERGLEDRRHHEGEGGARRRCGVRCDARVDAAGRADRAEGVRGIPGQAPQARHRP